jgi:broad specificity phosphatase PhoE
VQPAEELHELRPGDADGMTVDQWRDRYGGVDPPPPRKDPFRPFSPGGESWAAFLVRAGAALITLLDRHPDETIVAVCHAGIVEASFYLAFGLGSTGNRVSFAALNTGITHWRHDREPGGRRDWTIVTFNDAGHLAAATTGTESPHGAVPTPASETRLM